MDRFMAWLERPFIGAARWLWGWLHDVAVGIEKRENEWRKMEHCPHGCGATPATPGPHHFSDCPLWARSPDSVKR